MTMLSAEEVIAALGLEPHPLEGGFFHETYRTPQRMHGLERSLATAIYYLLTPNTCSAMHRLPTDELFHFYFGDPVQQLHLRPDGAGQVVMLGPDLLAGQRPQVLVPGGVWQGACLADGGRLALLGTTMTPGFAYPDYQKGRRDELTRQYPEFAALIERLTESAEATAE
jgi:predicted cupin superfamily sugar epimerase